MDNETLKDLLALREVNKALIDGLKAAVYFLDRVEQVCEEQRKAVIESQKGLIAQMQQYMGKHRQGIESTPSDELLWLANQILYGIFSLTEELLILYLISNAKVAYDACR